MSSKQPVSPREGVTEVARVSRPLPDLRLPGPEGPRLLPQEEKGVVKGLGSNKEFATSVDSHERPTPMAGIANRLPPEGMQLLMFKEAQRGPRPGQGAPLQKLRQLGLLQRQGRL